MTDETNPSLPDDLETDGHSNVTSSSRRLTWILCGILLTFGLLTLCSCLVLMLSFSDSAHRERDIRFHNELQALLDDIRAERASPSPDFTAIRQQAGPLRTEIVSILKNEASTKYPAKQALLFAARDELPRMLMTDLLVESPAEKNFATWLREAAAKLKIK